MLELMFAKESSSSQPTNHLPVFWLIAGGGFLILLDQLSKNFFFAKLPEITYCNPGIAYGIIMPPALFAITWWASMLFLSYGLFQSIRNNLSPRLIIPLAILIAGAISNGIDRLIRGCVIDFIPIIFFDKFNFADILIVSGAVFFALNLFILKDKIKK